MRDQAWQKLIYIGLSAREQVETDNIVTAQESPRQRWAWDTGSLKEGLWALPRVFRESFLQMPLSHV